MGRKTTGGYVSRESESKSLYIIDRLAQGATLQRIADELGMSVDAVRMRYTKEAKSQLAQMTNIVAEIKLIQTQQYNYIYNQAIKSWQLTANVDEEGNPQLRERDDGIPMFTGDVKFLDTAMKAMGQIRKIWDADKPIELLPEGEVLPMDETAEMLGGNINQVQDVLYILQERNLIPASLDVDQVSEHLLPVEESPPSEAAETDEIL